MSDREPFVFNATLDSNLLNMVSSEQAIEIASQEIIAAVNKALGCPLFTVHCKAQAANGGFSIYVTATDPEWLERVGKLKAFS